MNGFEYVISALFLIINLIVVGILKKMWNRIDEVKTNYLTRYERLSNRVGSLELSLTNKVNNLEIKITESIGELKTLISSNSVSTITTLITELIKEVKK